MHPNASVALERWLLWLNLMVLTSLCVALSILSDIWRSEVVKSLKSWNICIDTQAVPFLCTSWSHAKSIFLVCILRHIMRLSIISSCWVLLEGRFCPLGSSKSGHGKYKPKSKHGNDLLLHWLVRELENWIPENCLRMVQRGFHTPWHSWKGFNTIRMRSNHDVWECLSLDRKWNFSTFW